MTDGQSILDAIADRLLEPAVVRENHLAAAAVPPEIQRAFARVKVEEAYLLIPDPETGANIRANAAHDEGFLTRMLRKFWRR